MHLFLNEISVPTYNNVACLFLIDCKTLYNIKHYSNPEITSRPVIVSLMVGWLCLTSHRQRGHLETAPPFTVPCEGREARLIHSSDRELNPGPWHGSPLRYRCATQARLNE